ncbi:MAG: glutamine--tRNA ligase [Kiritimatiellaceae bacterium]|nr:glutamine--tRNA ligase [Kiritimatiellaceae bacterium]
MTEEISTHFIHEKIEADLASNKIKTIITRFPPEPNGYLHIGHAKAIHLDFGTALKYSGRCHLRFDDTNPAAEDEHYVHAIQEDIRWLGYDWGDQLYWASSYFDQMETYARQLIEKGSAYICNLSQDEFKSYRGAPTEPGREPPGRALSIQENTALFDQMKKGDHAEGTYVLRARIDMTSPNLHMRDPAIYRIKHAEHHHTGDTYHIYPMYDFAHCIEDSIEGITHSLCTLEFEVHRPLYEWILDELNLYRPQQIEFARLNITYMVMSKRKLLQLVEENHVTGWDYPRLPTLSGMRRRGFTPTAIRNLCTQVGCTKFESLTEIERLEACVRDDLNETSARAMAVLDPIKLIIENYPENQTEELKIANHPQNESFGTRTVPFTRECFIEREDYMDDAPNKFKRFTVGREVRLRGAYCVTCTRVEKDADGKVIALYGTYDPETRGVNPPDGRKVRGTIHWVSTAHACDAEIRLYDRLFTTENPLADKTTEYTEFLNPDSLQTIQAKLEPSLAKAAPADRFQFERIGYFCADLDHTSEKAIFNRTLTLRAAKKDLN